jgi:hypothetical protein
LKPPKLFLKLTALPFGGIGGEGLWFHETKISSGLMKQKYNCLAIMTIVMFGGKRGRLASQRTPSQPLSTGVAASCCGGVLLQGGLVNFPK